MLLGPTASGKSAGAMAIARRFPVEIVSVDSAQVYRGMDIGTAKPDADEQAQVRHHLIDLLDPAQAYSAARFCTDALAAIAQVRARGNTPLLVGGTMLYAKALTDGLHDLPSADAAVREQLNREAAAIGWPAMHARLAQVDPVTAARLPPGDSQRISRALEIQILTGQPMSALLAQHKAGIPEGGGGPDGGGGPGARFAVIALEPSDRAVLHQRIATRFDRMLDAGLLDEVARLRARGDLHAGLPSIRCVGYRQAWEHLEGLTGTAQMRELGITATRQLAKRQLTWLRSMPNRQVIDALAPDVTGRVIDAFAARVNATRS